LGSRCACMHACGLLQAVSGDGVDVYMHEIVHQVQVQLEL
jgi:hypothetical protein